MLGETHRVSREVTTWSIYRPSDFDHMWVEWGGMGCRNWIRGTGVARDMKITRLLFIKIRNRIITRWWFQTVFIFTPKIREDSQFDSYFSEGLVQPPTRIPFLFPQYNILGFGLFTPPILIYTIPICFCLSTTICFMSPIISSNELVLPTQNLCFPNNKVKLLCFALFFFPKSRNNAYMHTVSFLFYIIIGF